MSFEEIDLSNFPAEECNIPLRINSNFFMSKEKKLVLIRDIDKDCLMIKNLYPCLGEKDGTDIFGFVAENGLEFYNIENPKFIVEGFTTSENLNLVTEILKGELD